MLKQEAAACGADDPADLPRDAREREVAPDELRRREVGRERPVHDRVQALSEREADADGRKDDEGDRRRRPRACRPDAEQRRGPQRPHRREQAHASPSFDRLGDGQLEDDDADAFDREDRSHLALVHVRDVLRERGQELDHQRQRRGDERRVDRGHRDECAVAHHTGPASARALRMELGRGNARDDGDVGEKGRAVEEEERRERRRVRNGGDETRDETAERDAEVHHQPLQRIGGRALPVWRQRREHRRLRRPERPAAEPPDRVERERLPRDTDEGHQPERDRHHRERRDQHAPRAEPVGERPRDEAAHETGERLGRRDQPRGPERDPAHVVQVDDQEREHDAVAERVEQRAGLEHIDVVRQPRIEAAEVAPHGCHTIRLRIASTSTPDA